MEEVHTAGEEVTTRNAEEAMLDAENPPNKMQRISAVVCEVDGFSFTQDANEEDIPLALADASDADALSGQDVVEGEVPDGDCKDTH
eukprot:4677329-Amphidinium_carterae.1